MKLGAKISLGKDKWDLLNKLTNEMDFIEVYYTEDRIYLTNLLSLDTRWVVHGPHLSHGVNFAKDDPAESNIELFKKGIVLAHELGAEHVITHAGYYNPKDNKDRIGEIVIENILQLKKFAKQHNVKLFLENSMFKLATKLELHNAENIPNLLGFFSAPDEIEYILKKVRCEFLLDFSHAYITSINKGKDYKKFIGQLMEFKPAMFHLCDGKKNDPTDRHLPLGKGNYDLPFFLSLIGDHDVTLEVTPTLEGFLDSKKYIQKVLKLNSKA